MKRVCAVCSRIATHGNRCDRHQMESRSGRRHRRVRAKVLADAKVCAICGDPPTEDDPLTFDHIVPRALGGRTTVENAQAAHRSCNLRKGGGLR